MPRPTSASDAGSGTVAMRLQLSITPVSPAYKSVAVKVQSPATSMSMKADKACSGLNEPVYGAYA